MGNRLFDQSYISKYAAKKDESDINSKKPMILANKQGIDNKSVKSNVQIMGKVAKTPNPFGKQTTMFGKQQAAIGKLNGRINKPGDFTNTKISNLAKSCVAGNSSLRGGGSLTTGKSNNSRTANGLGISGGTHNKSMLSGCMSKQDKILAGANGNNQSHTFSVSETTNHDFHTHDLHAHDHIETSSVTARLDNIIKKSNMMAHKSTGEHDNQKWNVGKKIDMIIIGASAGGADALIEVLPFLPAYLPPVLVVQHMESRFTTLYANRLMSLCQMKVSELKDGEVAEHGHIYIAPGGYHTTIHELNGKCHFKLDISPKVSGHRPSVNVIFDSAARTLGNRALGVILTGMGDDGAQGLLKLRNTGAYTIGQDKATSLVYGMPRVAKEIGAVFKQLPLDKIAKDIVFRCGIKPGK